MIFCVPVYTIVCSVSEQICKEPYAQIVHWKVSALLTQLFLFVRSNSIQLRDIQTHRIEKVLPEITL